METVYLILPDTALEVSRDGGDFAPQILRKQLQFEQVEPDEMTDEHALFSRGPWWYRVKRADVVKSVQASGYGYSLFGV